MQLTGSAPSWHATSLLGCQRGRLVASKSLQVRSKCYSYLHRKAQSRCDNINCNNMHAKALVQNNIKPQGSRKCRRHSFTPQTSRCPRHVKKGVQPHSFVQLRVTHSNNKQHPALHRRVGNCGWFEERTRRLTTAGLAAYHSHTACFSLCRICQSAGSGSSAAESATAGSTSTTNNGGNNNRLLTSQHDKEIDSVL